MIAFAGLILFLHSILMIIDLIVLLFYPMKLVIWVILFNLKFIYNKLKKKKNVSIIIPETTASVKIVSSKYNYFYIFINIHIFINSFHNYKKVQLKTIKKHLINKEELEFEKYKQIFQG
jgi:hypothetical protein